MKRLFAAIKITPSENFLHLYYQLISSCKYDRINWVKPENIHITLKFFGETGNEQINQIDQKFQFISKNHKPFTLNLQDVGIFGSSYKPKVIWFGIQDNINLQKLATDILDKMEMIGFPKDRQNFVPHLTIGRIKFLDNKNQFSKKITSLKSRYIQDIYISEFYLFESILGSTGPTYNTINKYNLGA